MNESLRIDSSNSPDAKDDSVEDILQEYAPGGEDVEDHADEVDDD